METFNSSSSQLMPALDLHHYLPTNQTVKDNNSSIFSNKMIARLESDFPRLECWSLIWLALIVLLLGGRSLQFIAIEISFEGKSKPFLF